MAMYQGRRSTYDLTINEEKKVFLAQATGFFDVEDGESFIKDYKRITQTLQKDIYTLIINAPELQPSSPQVAEMLGSLLQMYMEVPFKNRILVTNGNPVTLMQFKRLGKSIPGWTESVQYVDDYSQALSMVK